MFFKKNIEKPKKIVNPKPKFPVNSYKLLEFWDTEKAKNMYSLYQYTKQYLMHDKYEYYWVYRNSGDLDWAKRTAEHFNIEITGEKNE